VRVAWFSPLPPVRSGISSYSAEVLPLLESPSVAIDRYPESAAHDFVWQMRRRPYDLVVYQLGNAPCHDYMWAYLARYPGLVVLHDARLHHARARRLLQSERFDDYCREFAYDHPDARPAFAEYAIAGLGASIYYFWPMLRVVLRTARLVAVHNSRVAADLAGQQCGAPVETIRMGVPSARTEPGDVAALRRKLAIPGTALVFAVFGKVTAEKRVAAILRAFGSLVREGRPAYLLLAGDATEYSTLDTEISEQGAGSRVRIVGYLDDSEIGSCLAAADACLCLRWPTAQETSASWLRCLAAGRPTVISDLPHLVDVPSSVAMRVDLWDEDRSLETALRRLADEGRLREELGRAGKAYWATHHTLEMMAGDYRRLLDAAARRPIGAAIDLPPHFLEDYSGGPSAILQRFDLQLETML
jgi:glycosyltransferase involved in cell wall biosynthesis